MNIRSFDLNLLLVLDALMKEKSVTRAAERLNLSQPAVSSSLGRLRDAFNDPLFVRTQRGVLPTPRAEELAETARSVLFDVEQMIGARPFTPAEAETVFTVGANDYGQFAVVAPLLSRMRICAPGVRLAVRLLAADIGEQLASEEIDVALTMLSEPPPDALVTKLLDETFVGVVGLDHPDPPHDPSLDEYCRRDHVRVSPANTRLGDPMDEALKAIGRTRNVVLTVPNFFMIPRMLRHSDLLSIMPRRLVSYFDWTLRPFRAPVDLPGFEMNLIWHRRTDASARHRWLREQMLESARTLSDVGSPR